MTDQHTAEERFPHGFSCHCPPCDKLHREDEIRRLIDICRRSGVDTIDRRLVDYIDALEAPKGTYNCPICGLNTPHRHESAGDPSPPAAGHWESIDTAPKNGRAIWVGAGHSIRIAYWNDDTWVDWIKDEARISNGRIGPRGVNFKPTHWMRLPDPPALASETPAPLTEADIVPGREFIWMPNMPGARCRVRVVEIQRHPNGDVDVAAMLLENSAVSRKDDVCRNDMSRFLEACVRAPVSEESTR